MVMLIFLHSAKQLAFRGRTIEPPHKKHEGTKKTLPTQREHKPHFRSAVDAVHGHGFSSQAPVVSQMPVKKC